MSGRSEEPADKAAKMFGVNERYVSDAKRIRELAPEKFEQMKAGQKSLKNDYGKISGVRSGTANKKDKAFC